jgi:hypothetical protein
MELYNKRGFVRLYGWSLEDLQRMDINLRIFNFRPYLGVTGHLQSPTVLHPREYPQFQLCT